MRLGELETLVRQVFLDRLELMETQEHRAFKESKVFKESLDSLDPRGRLDIRGRLAQLVRRDLRVLEGSQA